MFKTLELQEKFVILFNLKVWQIVKKSETCHDGETLGFLFQGCNEDKLIHGHQTVSVVFKLSVINKLASEKEHYNILTNQEPSCFNRTFATESVTPILVLSPLAYKSCSHTLRLHVGYSVPHAMLLQPSRQSVKLGFF